MQVSEIVNGLWIKGALSPLELLTIHSYIQNGFIFRLWIYDDAKLYPTMNGLELHDANCIIPKDEVFSYKHSNQFGHGKGSYAGFSDVFRYKLLYLHGGWWTDMDVTCLSAPSDENPYLFRYSKQREEWIVGNIIKVPAGSELMKRCYADALAIDENNKDWMAPIRILNNNIRGLGLQNYARIISNDDSWPVVSRLITQNNALDKNWHFIHWMNEEFRRLKLPKDVYIKKSTLGYLMSSYDLGKSIRLYKEGIVYRIKSGRLYYALLHFRRETLLLSLYYLGYNLFYTISDLYFITIKPHFDIGKIWRGFWSIFYRKDKNDHSV